MNALKNCVGNYVDCVGSNTDEPGIASLSQNHQDLVAAVLRDVPHSFGDKINNVSGEKYPNRQTPDVVTLSIGAEWISIRKPRCRSSESPAFLSILVPCRLALNAASIFGEG